MRFPTSFLLFFLLCGIPSFAELRESDTAISDYLHKKVERTRNEGAPVEPRLNFQKIYGIYAVFYDFTGAVIYLRFRRDKFDYKPLEKVKFLVKGHSYRVQFRDLRMVEEVPPPYSFPPERKGVNGRLLIGSFLGARSAIIEDLRY